jgi:hypothetical protein
VPNPGGGKVPENHAGNKCQARCSGRVAQLPGTRGVLSRITSICGTQTFFSRDQFNSCGSVNGKERRKITAASPARAHFVSFAARRANNFHYPLACIVHKFWYVSIRVALDRK